MRIGEKLMIDDPTTPPLTNPSFRMPIDEMFNLDNVGLMVVGHIQAGQINRGDTITIVGQDKTLKARVKNVEVRGDSLGIILEDVTENQIEPGMIVTTDSTQPTP
jgi:translation elongation factor EF-Tu-like GTPase